MVLNFHFFVILHASMLRLVSHILLVHVEKN